MKKTQTTGVKEPFLRIARREDVTTKGSILIRAAAIIAALVVDALFIFLVTGLNPVSVYVVMFTGTFGNFMRFKWAVEELAKLLLVGIALAPAFKMRFWNIGAEGQVLMGGLATAFCMIYFGNTLPTWLLFVTMFVTSIAIGALWGIIPAFFKARWNTNETLFTLMMNYVAIQLVAFATNTWRGQASSLGRINPGTEAGWFPSIMGQRCTINIIVIAILTVAMFIYLKYTKHGFEIAVVGESENTARYAGINVRKVILRTMAISGAICGLGGLFIVAGNSQTIATTSAGGRGFDAIIVAWLAKFNTFYMVLISFLIVFLEKGASQIATSYSIMNDYSADVISGIILFFILGSEFFINYRLIFRNGGKNA
ncbi:MAG: ABC transporter permease [Ruminococcaceae bacterium]|nr:ABC transporter permease [Oscillospiraceae bacterium]